MKTFDEIYETLPGNGWLTKPEAELLWRVAGETVGPILEVGCYQGRSTVLLASFGRRVMAVDPFAGFDDDDPDGVIAHAKYTANLCSRKIENVTTFIMKLEALSPSQLPPIGFAYLDGDHTYQGTLNQIAFALGCGAKAISIHDVNDNGGGLLVKTAAIEKLGVWDERVERLAVWRLEK